MKIFFIIVFVLFSVYLLLDFIGMTSCTSVLRDKTYIQVRFDLQPYHVRMCNRGFYFNVMVERLTGIEINFAPMSWRY